MPINYAPLLTQQEYVDALVGFITGIEGHSARVYADRDKMATIGYGYAFNRDNNVALWQAAGISLTAAESALLQKIDAATTNAEKTRLGLTWTRNISHAEATALLLQTYPEYEAPANALGMPFSFERAAFVSMVYNRGVNANMQGIISAVQSGNRAEAWYQMRYNSFTIDATDLPGLPKRRYLESAMFCLYNDSAQLSDAQRLDEAKQIYRMFTLHRDKIATYEAKYGVAFDGTRGSVITKSGSTPFELAVSEAAGLGITGVGTIRESLGLACASLLGDLAGNSNTDIANAFQAWVDAGNDPLNFDTTKLFYDTGRGIAVDARQYSVPGVMGVEVASNDIIIGEGVAGATGLGGDMLVGGMGNDLLIGGSGDDVLYGGAGNDIMAGGAGNDTYMLDGGGHDVIEDKLGNNRVFLNGKVLFEFSTSDGINYLSTDGAFSGIMSNGDFIVTDNATGDKVTLNKNFASGDFGITLSNASVDPITTLTITGDILPDDIDPAKAGIQAAADANGNPIGQDGAYADILTGTAGDDHILSGELNDDVGGGAGNDRIEGGAGNDYLYGGIGNDIVEGGADSDIVAGGTGDDTLVSGADNDVLSGGEGSDLIVAGAGDDYILGDADYVPQFQWPVDANNTIDPNAWVYSMNGTNWYHSQPSTFNLSVTPQADGGALFQPVHEYAAGNDAAAMWRVAA